MMARTLLLLLAALAVAASAAPSLRAAFTRQTPRVFNGTVVAVAGSTLDASGQTMPRRAYQFVDDATGQTFELTWAHGATKIPRQSTHGTLDATFDGSAYVATHFEPGMRAARELFVRRPSVAPSVRVRARRGDAVGRAMVAASRSGPDGDLRALPRGV